MVISSHALKLHAVSASAALYNMLCIMKSCTSSHLHAQLQICPAVSRVHHQVCGERHVPLQSSCQPISILQMHKTLASMLRYTLTSCDIRLGTPAVAPPLQTHQPADAAAARQAYVCQVQRSHPCVIILHAVLSSDL